MAMAIDILLDHAALFDLLQLGVDRAARQQRPILVSHTERIVAPDALDVFRAGLLLDQPLFFWEQASHSFAIVGVGTATEIVSSGPDRLVETARVWRSVLDCAVIDGLDTQAGSGPTLLGGFAFDPDRPHTATWHGFGDGSLVLPRLQLTVNDGVGSITLNTVVDQHSDPQRIADELAHLYEAIHHVPAPPRRYRAQASRARDVLPAAGWQRIVQHAIDAIRHGSYEKLVLSRAVEVAAHHDFDLPAVLDQLRTSYPSAYVFAIGRGDRCFVGATPERLVGVHSGMARASGLAGTTARGATEAEDERFGTALLQSTKDRHEHAVVVDMLRAALRTACVDVHAPTTPQILKLNNVQHLHTPVSGRLRPGYSLLDLVAELHPTPAVGGFPRADALAYIRDHEGLDRGWYAAPIGWLDARGEGDFAVALRSGVIHGAQATLFAGCGIVSDSDPQAEYRETQLKLRPMLTALGVEA